jgi:hypothetical protein
MDCCNDLLKGSAVVHDCVRLTKTRSKTSRVIVVTHDLLQPSMDHSVYTTIDIWGPPIHYELADWGEVLAGNCKSPILVPHKSTSHLPPLFTFRVSSQCRKYSW